MTEAVKTKIRIGRIGYTNTIPFYHQLAASATQFQPDFYEHYPTKINLALRKGKIDIAPISSLEYLNHQKEYCLFPGLAIGSRDFSGSVLLISKEKIEGLQGQTIALTRQSLSSAVLLRILLHYKYKYKNQFMVTNSPPHEMLKKYSAGLVIGDQALFYQPKDFVYKYDLSELWWNWTEKPFCFALWAVRKEYFQRNPKIVAEFYKGLVQNLKRNLVNLEILIKESLQISFLDPHFSKIFGYLFNLNYGLDASMMEGLHLYYRLAHRLKLSPEVRPLEFLKLESGDF